MARIEPDIRKPRVRRTQYTRKWYWQCKRCDRAMYGFSHWDLAYRDARAHVYSMHHYYNRYSKHQGATV